MKDCGCGASPQPEFNSNLSRRKLAAGAAWAVPAVMVASTVPAMAVSKDKIPNLPVGNICYLFYSGGTNSAQGHAIHFGAVANGDKIPAGAVLRWTITADREITVPPCDYTPSKFWTAEVSPTPGTRATSFTLTITFLEDTPAESGTNYWCGPKVTWNPSDYPIPPQTRLTITSTNNADQKNTLVYEVAKRYPSSVNKPGRVPHKYLSKDGLACYPMIRWSSEITRIGYDDLTLYPGSSQPVPPNSTRETPAKCE